MHVCSFFQATSHDQLGDPCRGCKCPCSPSEKTTYDVNQAHWNGAEDRHSKQVCWCPGHFSAGIKNFWSNKKTLTLKLRMAASWAAHFGVALKTDKKQVCFACPTFLQVTN